VRIVTHLDAPTEAIPIAAAALVEAVREAAGGSR
jgi:hypothetical protein